MGGSNPQGWDDGSDYTDDDKVEAIIAWAEETQDDFNLGMVKTCAKILEKDEDLSLGQQKGLDNIIRGFKIDVQEWI